MTIAKYICINGEFRRTDESFLMPHNRAFRYGDALCENIHVFATEPQFPGYHFKRLTDGMNLLYLEIPPWFTAKYMAQLITQLLNRNRIFKGGSVRLTVYRDAAGNVTPDGSRVSFMMESQSIPEDFYMLNERGLIIDLCPDYRLNYGPLSGIKSTNALIYVMAGLFCTRNQLDDAILLNEAGRIVGTCHSNIFLINGTSLFTPGLNQGCIAGVMRKVICELAAEAGFRVNDLSSLTPAVLEDADEVFLTNAIEGIRWVGACQKRRYYKKAAQTLIRVLNEKAFEGR